MTAEVLSILEDYEITEVRFFNETDRRTALSKIFAGPVQFSLLIVNRGRLSTQGYQYLQRMAKTHSFEILEFSNPVKEV